MLADYRLEMLRLGFDDPPVQPRTDIHIEFTTLSAQFMLLYSGAALARDAITPLNATGEDLENWRKALGLPEIKPSPSTGQIRVSVTGTASLSDGEPFTYPNGLRGQVSGNHVGIVDGDEVDAVSIDTGTATNFPGGTEVRFPNPPTNMNEVATVSMSVPMTGGTDDEDDDAKRDRVLRAIPSKPGGGNWAQHRQVCNDELPVVQDTFVYPAPGGPSTNLVIPVRGFDYENNIYSRAPSDAALSVLRNAVHREMPDAIKDVVRAADDEVVDIALQVVIPASVLSGGNGNGWLDQEDALWPQLEVSDAGRVTISSAAGPLTVTVDADTTTSPIAGLTRIAWWSTDDMQFRVFLVTLVTGGTGAWVITLDRPLVSSNGVSAAVGDYISPAAVKLAEYGKSFMQAMEKLGPGEVTADAERLPRSLRHPFVDDEWPTDPSFQTLETFREGHGEIADITWSYRSLTTPTVPATVADPPAILVPRHFGIYRQL